MNRGTNIKENAKLEKKRLKEEKKREKEQLKLAKQNAKKAKSKLVIDAGALGMLVNKPFSAFKLKSNTIST